MIDSVSWTCRDCGGTFVGDRPPGLVCGQCLAARLARAGNRGPFICECGSTRFNLVFGGKRKGYIACDECSNRWDI